MKPGLILDKKMNRVFHLLMIHDLLFILSNIRFKGQQVLQSFLLMTGARSIIMAEEVISVLVELCMVCRVILEKRSELFRA